MFTRLFTTKRTSDTCTVYMETCVEITISDMSYRKQCWHLLAALVTALRAS